MTYNKVLVLLVNYYNEDEVSIFVKSQLFPIVNEKVKIIIVDNGSKNNNVLKKIESESKQVTLLKSKDNLGYFGAAYLGYKYYIEKFEMPDFVLVSNTDIVFESNSIFERIYQCSLNLNFDVLGPQIYSPFLGVNQNPMLLQRYSEFKIKTLVFVTRNKFYYFLYTLLYIFKNKVSKYIKKDENFNAKSVYAVHGCFMIFNKSFFLNGGTLNYPSFLFGEELFIAETAIDKSLKIVYDPSIKIIHNQNTTTGTFKSSKNVSFMHKSYVYLLKSFYLKCK